MIGQASNTQHGKQVLASLSCGLLAGTWGSVTIGLRMDHEMVLRSTTRPKFLDL